VREDPVDAFEREADADAVLVAVNLGKEPRRFTSPYLHVVDGMVFTERLAGGPAVTVAQDSVALLIPGNRMDSHGAT
jgi:hypothetical protein